MENAKVKKANVSQQMVKVDTLRKVVRTEVLKVDTCRVIYKSEDAKNFLKHRPYFDELLEQVTEKLKQYFNNAELYLRLIHDPDFEDDELLLSVVTEKTPEDALSTLKKFDEEWWLDHSYLGGNKLNIDVMPI